MFEPTTLGTAAHLVLEQLYDLDPTDRTAAALNQIHVPTNPEASPQSPLPMLG